MAHRPTRKQRKARIDEKTGDSPVALVRAAGIIAKLMVDTEHMVGLADKPGHDPSSPNLDTIVYTKREDIDPRTGQVSNIKSGAVIQSLIDKLVAVVNDKMITLSPQDVAIINDPDLVMTGDGEVATRAFLPKPKKTGRAAIAASGQFNRSAILPYFTVERIHKKKRKVSSYSKEFGIQLKKLKKKHPRTPITKLMKRAHAATRKARK